MTKIGKLIDDLTGKTEEEIRLKEQYCFLRRMASAKSETLENQLKLKLSDKEAVGELAIVGDKAFDYRSGQHVNISPHCDDAIAGAIDEYFEGSEGVKAGFRVLVKQGLSRLIENTSIGEIEDALVFVYPENYSIVRVDVMAYQYTFSSKGVLANNVENVFVYTMAKSIVDHEKVGLDSLMHAVVDMLHDGTDENPNIEQVMPFLKELQTCWKMLDEGMVPANASNLLRGAMPIVDGSVKECIQREVEALTPEDVLASAKEGAIA